MINIIQEILFAFPTGLPHFAYTMYLKYQRGPVGIVPTHTFVPNSKV